MNLIHLIPSPAKENLILLTSQIAPYTKLSLPDMVRLLPGDQQDVIGGFKRAWREQRIRAMFLHIAFIGVSCSAALSCREVPAAKHRPQPCRMRDEACGFFINVTRKV
jgi:hypothetical protein